MATTSTRPEESISYGKIQTVEEIGAAIRAKRRSIGIRQEELASLAGVGPRFLHEVEHGKATAEIGKVLQVLNRLGLEVSISPRSRNGRA